MGTTHQISTYQLPSAATFRLRDIPEPLSPFQLTPGTQALARLGPIAVFRGSWGVPLDSERIIAHYVAQGWDVAEVTEMVSRTGFPTGYYFPQSNDLCSPDTQEWQAHYAAALAENVMNARDWDAIDVMIVASSSLNNDIPGRARDILVGRGYQVGQTKMYGQACNGALAGINDLCRDEASHGIRAVVIGMETLTGGRANPEDPITVRTFGNGGGSIAFIPGHEIQHITGRTVVEWDREGVIRGPVTYTLPPVEDHITPLPWYEFVGDQTRDYFAATDHGMYMQMPQSDDGLLMMQGKSTLMYFARRVPPLAIDVAMTYYQDYADHYGPLAIPLSHQPSLPVLTFVNQELIRLSLEAAGLERREARKLTKRATPAERAAYVRDNNIEGYVEVQIPWLMDRTGFNNISAGTSMAALVQMIYDDMVRPHTPVPVYGFGIGSVIQADVWRFTVDA